MTAEIITREDLEQFRMQLIKELKEFISAGPSSTVKPWLKSSEVRRLLNISAGKLQALRIAGSLYSSKIGGVHYYKYEDIKKLIEPERNK